MTGVSAYCFEALCFYSTETYYYATLYPEDFPFVEDGALGSMNVTFTLSLDLCGNLDIDPSRLAFRQLGTL